MLVDRQGTGWVWGNVRRKTGGSFSPELADMCGPDPTEVGHHRFAQAVPQRLIEGGLKSLTDTNRGMFGLGERGQLMHFSAEVDPVRGAMPMMARGMAGLLAVAATEQARFALDAKGRVISWGLNAHGQLGRESELFSKSAQAIPDLAHITQIAAGLTHGLALDRDGAVWAWGANGAGQLGQNHLQSLARPARVVRFDARIVQVAAGHSHSLALDDEGRIHAWGSNHLGQLGSSPDGAPCGSWAGHPVLIEAGFKAVQVDAGMHYSVAVSDAGEVFTWGWNGMCQLATEGSECSDKPLRVAGLPAIDRVSAGYHHVMASRDNAVFTWGSNQHSACGVLPAQQAVAVPQPLFFS